VSAGHARSGHLVFSVLAARWERRRGELERALASATGAMRREIVREIGTIESHLEALARRAAE
jgi:hypothetical protein